MTTPICLWSGPRNISTAMMYSFAQRDGIQVVDEPLYGHYLRVSGADHPGKREIMEDMNCDGNAVMRKLLASQERNASRRQFQKHMAHHLVDLDLDFLTRTSNLFLIRDPREMLPSLTVQLPHATLVDTGLKRQWELYTALCDAGQTPAILDARELLLNPAHVLTRLCGHLGLEYDARMLRWKAGPLAEDGVWAPHWYHVVHESTGFAPYRPKSEFPAKLGELLADCTPWYEKLFANAIRSGTEGD